MYDYESIIMDCHTCAEIGCGRRECSHKDADGCEAQLLIDAACAIDELVAERDQFRGQAKMVPKWISVEERLPELNKEVFVYAVGQTDGFFGDSVITKCKRCIFKPFPSAEGFEHWSIPWQYFHTDYKITHWMPLPEPPKEVLPNGDV